MGGCPILGRTGSRVLGYLRTLVRPVMGSRAQIFPNPQVHTVVTWTIGVEPFWPSEVLMYSFVFMSPPPWGSNNQPRHHGTRCVEAAVTSSAVLSSLRPQCICYDTSRSTWPIGRSRRSPRAKTRHDRHVSAEKADAWGIHDTWLDARKHRQHVSDDNVRRLREVVGNPPPDLEATAPIVTRPGARLGESGQVHCEDDSIRALVDTVPDDFPLGYHRIRHTDGRERALIVSPGRCWLPDGWRAWGWTVQLYAARSRGSWGIGDLRDLRRLREWSQRLGAEFLLINPLHAVAPTFPQEASPYLPTSRRFRNPIYLCVDECAGADLSDLSSYAHRGHELNARPLIDRDEVWALKVEALQIVFDRWRTAQEYADGDGGRSSFARWRQRCGRPLEDFAVWMVVAAQHGHDWRSWPQALHDPRGEAVARLAARHASEVEFQVWLQWQLDEQLRIAGTDFNVIQDLPIGVDGGGADAWMWQDVIAADVTVGAPPDLFSSHGQNWGSPPLVPWRLRAADYQPFIESMRSTMSNAGGLRIDHVMGLFRIWWVPPGGAPSEGGYVRYPSDDLLDIVALESHRQRALVVGEDLGTVEAGVREALEDRAILSYRLLWFEETDPDTWPVSAMAAITTHDLPTIAGLWTGADLEDQRMHSAEDETALQKQRENLLVPLRRAVRSPEASAEEAVIDAHRLLATAPSILVSATLDDAVAAVRRPNMPGTAGRDNWCYPLPVLIDELDGHPLARQVANVLKLSTSVPTKRVERP
jgi:4-alpha-glucanotransferase